MSWTGAVHLANRLMVCPSKKTALTQTLSSLFNMITKLQLKRGVRSLPASDVIDLEPVTILVGEQGAGKSTLLQLLANKLVDEQDAIAVGTSNKARHRSWSYDFEKDNPRVATELRNQGGAFQLRSHCASHGETSFSVLEAVLEQSRDETEHTVYLLDEPDANLSPRRALQCAKLLKAMAQNAKVQVVASIHNPWIIAEFATVLCLPELVWLTSNIYLEGMRAAAARSVPSLYPGAKAGTVEY